MSFNFSELQQAYLRNLETIDSVIEMLRKLPGTGYQQVQYYDKNGNLVTKNIPNIGQLIQEFQQGVNSVMAKKIYVDAENGNDNTGNGSSSAPFKTIKKAIDSVPEGGYGSIFVKGEHIISRISIKNKSIFIATYGEATIKPKVNTRTIGQTTYYEYIGFILESGASLNIFIPNSNDAKLKLAVDDIDDQYPITPLSGFIVVAEGASSASCHIQIRTHIDNRTPIHIGRRAVLFSINEWSTDRPAHISFSLSGQDKGKNRHIVLDGDLANLKASPASLYVNYRGGFKDSAGNHVDIKTKVKGIIKDSNGVPRNVISNIIF